MSVELRLMQFKKLYKYAEEMDFQETLFDLNQKIEALDLEIKKFPESRLILKSKIQNQKIILKEAHHDQTRIKSQYKQAQRFYMEDQSDEQYQSLISVQSKLILHAKTINATKYELAKLRSELNLLQE